MKIFVAAHRKDLLIPNLSYLIPVQSGTALANERFDGWIHDDDGIDNISNKNPLYAELDVQYYIWKNMNFDDEEIRQAMDLVRNDF